MTATFSVKNFDKFQHYKDRTPPWIKFHNSVLDDYALAAIPDASKAHLFAIWLLASRYDNVIPADAEWVARRINATDPVDLEILASAGFIELNQPRSSVLADSKQDACLEREAEGEAEAEKETKDEGADAKKSKYAFCGKVIRVTHDQFSKWGSAYHSLDLFAELTALDDYYLNQGIKDWFVRCSNALASKHRKNVGQGQGHGGKQPPKRSGYVPMHPGAGG